VSQRKRDTPLALSLVAGHADARVQRQSVYDGSLPSPSNDGIASADTRKFTRRVFGSARARATSRKRKVVHDDSRGVPVCCLPSARLRVRSIRASRREAGLTSVSLPILQTRSIPPHHRKRSIAFYTERYRDVSLNDCELGRRLDRARASPAKLFLR
jgi:hypothetical protein